MKDALDSVGLLIVAILAASVFGLLLGIFNVHSEIASGHAIYVEKQEFRCRLSR